MLPWELTFGEGVPLGQCSSVKPQSSSWPSAYILIVEDDDYSRNAFRGLLQAWGYKVETADCGQRGLEIAQNNYPSVAFVDLNIPDMSGYELAAQLRELAPQRAKLFAISAHIREADENRLFDGLFQKPVDLDLIWNLLRGSFPSL